MDAKERLVAILAGDVVGFSRLMRTDERATLATLDEFRGVFREAITSHGGRVVDMAGDSVLAIFETATGAVIAATEVQAELAKRNETLNSDRRMEFRIGVNLGDILEKEDGSVYGDGVNVAARLQSTADAGGINVSGTVFESVRTKVAGPFSFRGEQQFKNIEGRVAVYHLGPANPAATAGNANNPPPRERSDTGRATVLVAPIKVISGGPEVKSLAQSLQNDLVDSLNKQTAIRVILGRPGEGEGESGHSSDAVDFRLEGSIRAAGDRLRLFFTLFDAGTRAQAWSERFERSLDDIFDLEDEITLNVAASVRIRIKARAFEKLRDTVNDALTVPDLLSKAAGYIVSSYAHNDEVAKALDCALSRAPDNAMAIAMRVLCRYREWEFSVLDVPDNAKNEWLHEIERALSHEPASFFAHLVAAIVHQDLFGDFETALVHAESSLRLNSGFSQATAMVGIGRAHLDDPIAGLDMLKQAMAAVPDDPHRFRHARELALLHFATGDFDEAVSVQNRLVHEAPDLWRNQTIMAALHWHAGREDKARHCMQAVLAGFPDVTIENARPTRFHDADIGARFEEGLLGAGLPGGMRGHNT